MITVLMLSILVKCMHQGYIDCKAFDRMLTKQTWGRIVIVWCSPFTLTASRADLSII